MLTIYVAWRNIIDTIFKRNDMQDTWYVFRGNQSATRNTRDAIEEDYGEGSTIVLGGKEYFYAKVDAKYFEEMIEIRKATKVTMELCDAPQYQTAYCGKLSTSVEKHQYACHACREVKEKNLAWSEATLENEIAKTEPHINLYDQGEEGQPGVSKATTILSELMVVAEKHRDEHVDFTNKWNRYLLDLGTLLHDIQESSRQLKEAQARYDANTIRIATLLQTGDDD